MWVFVFLRYGPIQFQQLLVDDVSTPWNYVLRGTGSVWHTYVVTTRQECRQVGESWKRKWSLWKSVWLRKVPILCMGTIHLMNVFKVLLSFSSTRVFTVNALYAWEIIKNSIIHVATRWESCSSERLWWFCQRVFDSGKNRYFLC